jgi:hypothetical protein
MRFYLNVFNRTASAEDEEGVDLPDLEAARLNAIEGIRSIIASEAKTGKIDFHGRVEILGDDRRLIAVVRYRDAVEVLQDE